MSKSYCRTRLSYALMPGLISDRSYSDLNWRTGEEGISLGITKRSSYKPSTTYALIAFSDGSALDAAIQYG